MYTCCICRFDVELDDTVTTTAKGGCICLRCYLVQVEDHKQLPKDLRKELTAVVAAA